MAGRKAAGTMNNQQEDGMSAGWLVLGWHGMGVQGCGGTLFTLVSSSRNFPFVDGFMGVGKRYHPSTLE